MEPVKEIIVESWHSALDWIEENPRVTTALATCATIWTVSQLLSIHKQYSQDEKELTTNIDNVRARRLALSKVQLECPDSIQMDTEYVAVDDDGYLLYTRCYIPKNVNGGIKGMICYNHGWSDNLDCLVHDLCVRWAQRGFIIFSHEHIGHGRSDGLRSYCDNFNTYARHASYVHKRAKIKYSKLYDIPPNSYFLCGESLGGAVSIHEKLYESEMNVYNSNNNNNNNNESEFDWNGMCLAAPMCFLDPSLRHPAFVEFIFRYLIVPFIPAYPGTPAKDLSFYHLGEYASSKVKEKLFSKEYNPLRLFMPLRFVSARELVDATTFIMKNSHKITIPLMVVHSQEDKVTDPHGSQMFVNNVSSKDKTLKLYDKSWHMIWHDCHGEKVMDDVEEWMQQRKQK